jgi:YesN/AraC family two-component response regulator
MPRLTGKELILKLKEIKPDILTIICTGYSNKMNEAEAQTLGADAFMMKPLDLPKLLQAMRQILDGDKK